MTSKLNQPDRPEWEQEFSKKFNSADKFVVYKFLPHETYANAVGDIEAFLRSQVEAAEKRGRIAGLEDAAQLIEKDVSGFDRDLMSDESHARFMRIVRYRAAAIRAEKEKTGV